MRRDLNMMAFNDFSRTMNDLKPVVLTCARPTAVLTLGNYLGAIRNWQTMLSDYTCFFGIVDLHSLTDNLEPAQLRRNTLQFAAQYVACGLDPEQAHIFIQSHVIGHTELAWVLGCLTPIGELQRMTQFKEKAARLGFQVSAEAQGGELRFSHAGARPQATVNAGLLFYPILMAADILLYNAAVVPVGEDQKQHLEMARDLAQRFNNRHSETFTIPEPYVGKTGARVMSLQDPTSKMSKTDDDKGGTLFIIDCPDVLRKKIMSAVTDSGTEIKASAEKPGITNLLGIYAAVSGQSLEETEAKYAGKQYGAFKSELADLVIALLAPVRARYEELLKDRAHLERILREGAEAAQKQAYRMLAKVYRKVGLLERPR